VIETSPGKLLNSHSQAETVLEYQTYKSFHKRTSIWTTTTADTHLNPNPNPRFSMYYIAGLALPVSSTQAVEGLVVFTTFRFFQYNISSTRAIAPVAEAEAGAIRMMPTTFIAKAVTPVHGLAMSIPPVTYMLCVAVNRFIQPSWMQRMSLPDNYVHQETKLALRVAACASTFVLLRAIERAFTHLGNQWHFIGVWIFLTLMNQ